MKKLLAMILATLMLVSFAACSKDGDKNQEELKDYLQNDELVDHVTLESGETYYFDQVDSESVTITKYEGPDAKHVLTVPEKLDNKTVVSISALAFKDCTSINAVVFPESVTEIGDYAFAGCLLITSVKLSTQTTAIGTGAFQGCAALATINLAETKITEIKNNTFNACKSLTEVTVIDTVKTVGKGAFFDCDKLATVVVEAGVEVIGQQAFQNCEALASVTLPATLTSIGAQAFSGSDNLYKEGLTLAEGATVAAEYFAEDEYQLANKPVVTE